MASQVLFAVSRLFLALVGATFVFAAPITKRNTYNFVMNNPYGDAVFELGNVSYLANTKHPKVVVASDYLGTTTQTIPITVIKTNATTISQNTLDDAVTSYLDGDDVFNEDFLDAVYISSSATASLDASAIEYLTTLGSSFIFVDESISAGGNCSTILLKTHTELPAGPYLASINAGSVSFATVFRLYPDTHRTFLFGTYDANDGEDNHYPFGAFLPKFWDPMIP